MFLTPLLYRYFFNVYLNGCMYKAGMVLAEGDGLFLLILFLFNIIQYIFDKIIFFSKFVNYLNVFEVEFYSARICIDLISIRRKFINTVKRIHS